MSVAHKITMLFVGAVLLAGCTITAQQNRNITPMSKPDSAVISANPALDLSAIRSQKAVAPLEVPGLKTIYADGLDIQKQLKIHLMADFGRKFFVCQTTDDCEQVNLAAKTQNRDVKNAFDAEKGAPAGNAVGEVYLSEQTKQLLGRRITAVSKAKKILIMAPDVELNLLTAGGLQEPNALWTGAATNYITEFTVQYLTALGHEVAIYKDGAHDVSVENTQDLLNLHEAVGKSIFLYQYPGLLQLPTKKSGKFDWRLGTSVRAIGDPYGADLGLFFFVRDSYSSGSRVAAQVLMAALFGAHLQWGTQVGFVSLVDMKNGDIIWYNRLISTSGDLRRFEPAFKATESLLENIPL